MDVWEGVTEVLGAIELRAPSRAQDVVDLVVEQFGRNDDPDHACWFGEGGELAKALECAGWEIVGFCAGYLWEARYPNTREWLTFAEGDLFAGEKHGLLPVE